MGQEPPRDTWTCARAHRRRPSAMWSRWLLSVGCLALVSSCASAPSTAGDRFVGRVALRDGFVCVVAEGDLEPRSIGTFAVRAYRDLDVGDYVAGVITPRNGFVKAAYRPSRDPAGSDEIVVEVETAGSGRYVETLIFDFDARARSLRLRQAN